MYNSKDNKDAYAGLTLPISGAEINGTGMMLGERVKYTARTSRAIVSTANSNLDGTGDVQTLIIGCNVGCIVKRIIIKAQGNTEQGMIRLYHRDASGTSRLYREIEIPAITQSSEDETLIKIIDEPFYLIGTANGGIRVSTEKANTFIVTAEGLDLTYP